MPSTYNPIARRTLTVFYVLDTSGSMADDGRIGMLNEAMRETVDVLSDIARSNADAEMKIAILEFNSGATWITDMGPIFLEDFIWDDLRAGGLTDIGMALEELDDKMSREKYMSSDTGQYQPVVIFMSDGYPTDNWEKPLNEIKTNNLWYQSATKVAFAIGEDADERTLSRIVGNSEAVVKTDDLELFRRLIRFVSVRSSLINGTSRLAANNTTGADIVKESLKDTDLGKIDTLPEYIDQNDGISPEPELIMQDEDNGWDDGGW